MTKFLFTKDGPNPRRQSEYPSELVKSPLHSTWVSMKSRCLNPKNPAFYRYGGRGIKVCDRWLKFAGFWKDMGASYQPGLTLDRINNDGNYEPDNCRWTDRVTQGRNTSKNHLVTIEGETKTITEWADIYGVKRSTVFMRLNYGWNEIEAITTEVKR